MPWIPDLTRRRRRPELMDQPGLDPRLHREALAGLGRLHRITRTAARLWPSIRELAREAGGREVRVLDLACGGGDLTVALRRRALAADLRVKMDGCDLSPVAVDYATGRAAAAGVDCRFFQSDAVESPLPEGYDALVCSLFLHHLDERPAIELLRRMARAAERLVLVDDLVRSPSGYLYAYTGCLLLSRSKIVRTDGPLSVAGAFTPAEALALAGEAGLAGARLRRHWPQRFLLSWRRR